MAHEITERDGMFTVREAAWHGLGTVLPDHPSREEAQKIAHPWEPVDEPVFQRVLYWDDESGDMRDKFVEVPGQRLVVRDDTHEALGVVSDTYEIVRNEVMYDIAEAIEGEAEGSVMFETGGSLKAGRKTWLLIRLRDPLQVPGDPNGGVIPYYALQNAHDGSGAFRGQATMTRIVCDNTAQMADLDAKQRGTEFVFSHTKNVHSRIEEARAALAGWRESVDGYMRMMEHLRGREVDRDGVLWFVEEFIPMPKPGTASERVCENVRQAQREWLGILDGVTCEGIGSSAYGLVQASVEYLNHARRARSNETRFKRAYLDRSRLVSDAVELAEAL